ncbi:MAG: CHAT domain-containing protein [Saprospiraceae bacterium]|nr:CHAT domain-containing protein [Saprospiraceae bacterium]
MINVAKFNLELENNVNVTDSNWIVRAGLILDGNFDGFQKDSNFLFLADKFHNKGREIMDLNLKNARTCFFAAVKLRRHFYQSSNQYDVLRAYYNIGSCYFHESYYSEAIAYFDSIQLYSAEAGFYLSNLALILKLQTLNQLNEFDQAYNLASSMISKILVQMDSTRGEDPKQINEAFGVLVSLVENFLNIELQEDYIKHLMVVIDQIDAKLVNYGQVSIYQEYIGRLENLRGFLLIALANLQLDAHAKEKYYRLAITNFRQAESKFYELQDYARVAIIKRNLTYVYFKTLEFDKGIEAGRAGIQVLEKLSDPTHFNNIPMYLGLGANLYKANKLDSASMAYFQALLLFGPNLKPGELPNIGVFRIDYKSSLVLLGSIGRLRLRLAQDSLALLPYANAAYDTLFALINDLRANLINDEAKMLLAKQSQEWLPDAFEDIKQLYYLSKDSFYLEQAFKIAEQGKAFSLLEASRLKNASELLSKELQRNQEELNQLELKAVNGSDSVKHVVEQKKIAFLSKLKKQAPDYFALKFKGPDISISAIQQSLLDSNQAMLQYFVQEERLNVFVLTKDLFALDTIPIHKDELYSLIDQFYDNINPENEQGSVDPLKSKKFIEASNTLYRNLLGKTMAQYTLPERLIIIPDGRLNDLSFDALLCKVDEPGNDLVLQAKSQNYLIQNKSISYCFSASLLQEMKLRSVNSNLSNQLALFAPVFQKESTTLPFMVNQEAEVKSIQSQVSDAKLNPESSKEEFLKAIQKYNYLHLCAHGFVSQDPDQSFIAFRQNSTTPDTTQFFYLEELYHHKLNQELITLTACETALGEHMEGEGNISLARGFAYAGVKSFITTLWKIQTSGAAQIVPAFYKYFLKEKMPKDVALATSKRDFLNAGKGVYPENWAGMILIGNTAPAAVDQDNNWWMFVSLVILLLVLLLWQVFKRR